MDSADTAPEAVGNPDLSTAAVHGANGGGLPFPAVFPVVHTLYDYDERK